MKQEIYGRIGVRYAGGTDCYSPDERSYVMSQVKSSGNKTTELRFVKYFRKYGIKGWRRGSKLFGKPDFIFSKTKIAIFLDGDFWHGNPKTLKLPQTNTEYWANRIAATKERDLLVSKTLKKDGWKVFRFWESELKKDIEAIMAKLRLHL